MVRSHFPGKPRSGHRKLISASSCAGGSNEASLVAENIYHGLSAFNATFGHENEQLSTFHGFSPHQVSDAKKAAEASYKHVEKECEARGVIFNPFLPSNKFLKRYQTATGCGAEINCNMCPLEDKENTEKLNCDTDCSDIMSNGPMTSNRMSNSRSNKKILRENLESPDISMDSFSSDSDMCSSKGKLNNANSRKFVLPCRSIHSSRVIKPNKRFMDSAIDDSETASVSSETGENQPLQSSNFVPLKKPKLIFDENKGRDVCWKIDASDATNSSLTSTPSTSRSPLSKGILREAILNIELSPIKTEGLKSSNRAKANTIVCGVCGAVRFYKFKKQTRKFGVISCESCRKFISKMVNLLPTKNAASYNGGVLECHNQKGRIGCCDNPSILRNKEWNFKNVKLVNNQRCPACWLNTCIRKYNIPIDKRIGLSKMVPQEMRIPEFCEEATLSSHEIDYSQQQSDSGVTRWRRTHDKLSKLRKKRHKNAINSISNMARFISAVKNRDQSNETRQKKMEIESRMRVAKNLRKRTSTSLRSKCTDTTVQKLKKNTKDLSKKNKIKKLKKLIRRNIEKRVDNRGVNKASIEERRDKYFMKGPRVKHVCRSASIVLGQPMATFPISSTTVSNNNSPKSKEKENPQSSETPRAETPEPRIKESTPVSAISTSDPNDSDEIFEAPTIKIRDVSQKSTDSAERPFEEIPLARTLQDLGKQQEEEAENQTISVDFWENYDPEEVCKTGFALIASEPIHVPALCFLCGSAGVDRLVHCVSCCEAYHQYCVEMNMHPSKLSLDRNWWRVDWICPKCTFCTVCNDPAPQLCCQRCLKSYHSNCLSPNRQRPHLTDKTWVCPSCLRCKSCNQTNVSKFIGNLPLCSPCFKLRQKGNFCPLCQRCYEDDDYDSKMMECGKCKSWVHAKCEGLSNEKYQVLSYLPESVEYICRVCCDIPPASWWLAVEEELKTGYLNVLKCLSKNKKACDILKWSPKKRTADCVCRSNVRVKPLRFSDSQPSGSKTIHDSDNKCLSKDSLCDIKQNELASNLSDSDMNESDINLNKTSGSSTLNASNLLHVSVENNDCQGNFYGTNSDKTEQFSPHATQSDSGIGSTDDELKATSSIDGESNLDERSFSSGQCYCSGLETWTKAAPTLLSIKKKVSGNEYSSLLQFHDDVESVINSIVESEDLTQVYHQTMAEVFPWFDPQESKVFDASCATSSCDVSMDDNLELETNDIADDLKNEMDENITCLLGYEKDYYYLGKEEKDERICALCKGVSEGPMFEEGRLLYCGHNDWIHSNCALWSSEVFEEIDGSLQNVHSAISRGKMIRCSKCAKKGATVGCCTRNCTETYHFPCAREASCTFLESKTIRCQTHAAGNFEDKILTRQEEFHISRPVYVELERKKKRFLDYRAVKLVVGSLHIHSLGKFEPQVSDTSFAIIPIEFSCSRLFWSSSEPWKVIPYHIKTILIDANCEYDADLDMNYTVDHSVVNESIEEINLAVCEVVSFLCDSVQFKEEESEGQSNVSDLLSEQDTIFEDLPNEFFDGVFKDISMKMMSIEDLVAAGDKDDSNPSDSDGNNMMEIGEDDSQNCPADLPLKRNFDFSLSSRFPKIDSITQTESAESICSSKNVFCKGLSLEKGEDAVLHVKIQEEYNETNDNSAYYLKESNLNSLRLLQVDGVVDCSSCSDTSSNSDESESFWPEEENQMTKKNYIEEARLQNESPTYEIPQLDGSIEISDETEENPVKCSRCRRTYRTDVSYQRHLSSCNAEYMSSSGESDNEDETKCNSIHNRSTETSNSDIGDSLHVSEINLVDDVTVTMQNSSSINMVSDNKNLGNNFEFTSSGNSAISIDQTESLPSIDSKKVNPTNTFCASITVSKAAFLSGVTSSGGPQYVNSINGKGRPLKTSFMVGKSEPLPPPAQFGNPIMYQQTPTIMDQPQYTGASVTTPTFILQQVPQQMASASINISSFVQPVNSTPNVQYIAAVESSNQPQFIATPDPMNPGSFRIQQSSLISPIVPQVVGAIIQPPVEQIVTMNPQASNIDFFAAPNPSNNIFLSSQPVMNAVVNNSILCNSVMSNSLLNNTLVNNPVMSNAVLNNSLISNPLVSNGYHTMTSQLVQSSKPAIEATSYVIVTTNPSVKDCFSAPLSVQSAQSTTWAPSSNWSFNKHTCKTTKEVTTLYHAKGELIPNQCKPSQVNCVKVVKKETTEEMMIETASVNNPFYEKISAELPTDENVPADEVSRLTNFVKDIPAIFNAHSLKPLTPLPNSSNSSILHQQNESSKDVVLELGTKVPSISISKTTCAPSPSHLCTLTAPQTEFRISTSISKPQVAVCKSVDENVETLDPPSSPPYSVTEVFSNQIKNFRTYSGKKLASKLPINNVLQRTDEKQRTNNILQAVSSTVTSTSSSPQYVKNDISYSNSIIQTSPLSSVNNIINSVLSSKAPLSCKISSKEQVNSPPKTFHSDYLADSRILKPANKIENLESKIKNGLTKHENALTKPKTNLKNGKKCNKPKVVFEINSEDGFSYSTTNLADAWQKIFEAVQQAREARKLPPLPQNPFKNAEASLRTLGLDNNGLKYLLEQLPGVGRCAKYKPTYHKPKPNIARQDSLKENKSGCARSEPLSTRKEKYDMFSWLASRHRRPPKLLIASEADLINGNRRSTSINLPMAMRFRHLRETSREAVGVFRSDIHGRGLFCLRDIDAGEMVIEYAGEVIRSALTDKRENFYNSKGIGCYMFRIDDYYVVDATLKGNAARFINHSCEPNCYSRIVDILGKKHILIFAQRRIPQGEELTYDYKFPLEDDKISCHCLSRKCRKYLN
nr:PREDICTED: histone-lysine N-methyltransferase trithorax-like isoform X1 [Bemisia tabaci]